MAKKPMQSNVVDETIQKHQRLYALQKRKCEEENGVLRSILKAAKSDGVNNKQLIASHEMSKLEPEVVRQDLHDLIRYLALKNMPTIAQDLFGDLDVVDRPGADETQDAFQADDEGYSAGMGGQTAGDNPKKAGTVEFVSWEQGRVKGAEAKANILGQEGAMADASKARPKRAGDAPAAPKPPPKKPGARAGLMPRY